MTNYKYITFVSTLSKKEIKVPVAVFSKFITIDYDPQPYWYHNQKYKKVVEKYIESDGDESKLNEDELKLLKDYILFFVENVLFASYLMYAEKTNSALKLEFFIKKQLEILKKIRDVYKKGSVSELYDECLRYGIDPF